MSDILSGVAPKQQVKSLAIQEPQALSKNANNNNGSVCAYTSSDRKSSNDLGGLFAGANISGGNFTININNSNVQSRFTSPKQSPVKRRRPYIMYDDDDDF